ncbi:MAG: hypothetical protein F6K40_22525 [Okeania sp. SIO3I5]|uniref:hypothetical protein n=1 Tax=Okeania sp. SIO3I5 TaxID=2607805 RepID=UPI0013BB1DA4|nr:hypothetical protein [Okeania sp. SIO3I5]NEQ38895.1 hypothetical protein [Okeania sp. SIO3I5]
MAVDKSINPIQFDVTIVLVFDIKLHYPFNDFRAENIRHHGEDDGSSVAWGNQVGHHQGMILVGYSLN